MINKIELKNIFKHTDSVVEFTEGINLIVGPNDSGKSSIVEGIAFALFLDTTKAGKLEEIESDYGKPSRIKLWFGNDNVLVVRGVTEKDKDKVVENNKVTVRGRMPSTQRIEEILGFQKYFYMNIVYAPQDSLFSIINMTPSERERIVNRILNLDHIDVVGGVASRQIHIIDDMIAENRYILKKLELSSEKRKQEILEELKEVEAIYREKKETKDNLLKKHELYMAYETFDRKRILASNYFKLKSVLEDIRKKENSIKELESSLDDLKSARTTLNIEIKHLQDKIYGIKEVIDNGICNKCLRPVESKDVEIFEAELKYTGELLEEKLNNLKKIKSSISEVTKTINSIKQSIKYNPEKLKVKMLEIRREFLKLPSFRELKKIMSRGPKPEKDFLYEIEKIDQLLKEINDNINRMKWEYNELLSKQIKKERENISSRLKELRNKQNKLRKIKKIIHEEKLASKIRTSIIQSLQVEKIYSIFNVGKMIITPELDIYINDKPIRLASGAQKVACALSLRLAMLRLYNVDFMVLDEPTIYLDNDRIDYLKEMLKVIIEERILDQVILITHDERFKEIANNIIEVTTRQNGESLVKRIGGTYGG